ncbi:MAG: TlyA family methyltransferase [Glaciihabitans sp.]|nr:TlyA family methyltransferase [Glaciihabitans sp.]
MAEGRLDSVLGERGLARSRTHAARLIADGLVTVDGIPQVKASFRVRSTQTVVVAGDDHYVSRAAHKLIAALDAFSIPVAGRQALDVGASTGGFSQVLLERDVAHVIALDVGHGQLSPVIAADPRITKVEGVNARYLTADLLAKTSRITDIPTLVVADLSFIALPTVLPALVATVGTAADFVLLVKPQFEVGRGGIKEGIVRSGALRREAVSGVLWAGWDNGLGTAGVISSPIAGSAGNLEYIVYLSAEHGTNPTGWLQTVAGLA